MELRKKVIVLTAMHGRHETVAKCYNKMKNLDIYFIYGYSTDEDGEFLHNLLEGGAIYKTPNMPLSNKFQTGLELARNLDFDVAIMLGSDDYIDEAFLNYVVDQTDNYDFIGFKDIFFEQNGYRYYWNGYTNHRKGEPSGAGKTYTLKALQMLDFKLYNNAINRGLDSKSWGNINELKINKKIASVKDEGILLVDVKDKGSLTPLNNFSKLEKI